MIRSITGHIDYYEGTVALIATISGVGYMIFTTSRHTWRTGDEVRLFTHLAVRETALDLYGFTTLAELELFELLLTIPKIGPKSGLQALEQANYDLLIECISSNDAGRLSKLSSISKKTAEKIVTELHNKLPPHLAQKTDVTTSPQYQDAFDTLITLGYNPNDIRTVLDNLDQTISTSEMVSSALKVLH